MNTSKDWKDLYTKFKIRYQDEGLKLRAEKFQNLVRRIEIKAQEMYKKIPGPKLASEETYVRYWIRDSINHDLARKSIKGFSITKPPPNLKNTALFAQLLPPESVEKLHKQIYNAKPEERKKVWESFNMPVEKIENRFLQMIKERNKNNRKKGQTSPLNFYLNLNNISLSEYNNFLKNTGKVIKFCNANLPDKKDYPKWFYSEFNNYPCFTCQIKTFPFKTLGDVFNKMSRKFIVLSKYKNKVKIVENGTSYSSTRYVKEGDELEIVIDSHQNIKHRSLDMIHELGHAVSYINDFQMNKIPAEIGKYHNEEEAYKIEFEFLRRFYPKLYKSNFAPVLSNLIRVLFEIKLYENPNQNPGRLFSQMFNKCFIGAKQRANQLYLVERRVLYQPFNTLAHAVAEVNVISKFL